MNGEGHIVLISANMSQAETRLTAFQRDLRKQKQMREKELQLCHQLDGVYKRQWEAHKRNQDLLTDFKRIERELATLAAKTNHFRRNQVTYMKQSQTILPMHYERFAPSSCVMSHVKQSYYADNDSMPVNCGNFAKPCHFKDSLDHFCQTTRNHRLWPHHLTGLHGCCSHSTCHCCMYYHSGRSYEQDKQKILDSMQDNESQKKRLSTNDLLFFRADSSNKKDTRSPQCPELTNEESNNGRGRINPQQDVWNKDIHRDSSKTFLIGAKEIIVGEIVKTAVRRSSEDNLGDVSASYQEVPPNSITEEQNYSEVQGIGSTCKLQHLPLAFICHDNNTAQVNNGVRKRSTQQIFETSLRRQSSEQNMPCESFIDIQNANFCTESMEARSSMEATNVDDREEKGLEVKMEDNKDKQECISNSNQETEISHKSFEETRIKPSLQRAHIDEDVPSRPIMKLLSNQTLLNKCDRDANVEFVGDSLDEEISDSEETSDEKYLKRKPRKCKTEDKCQSPNERSAQSDRSESTSSLESDRRWSVCEDHENVVGEAKCESNILPQDNSETETDEEITEENKSENEEPKEEVMGILQGTFEKIGISECALYSEDTEIKSGTEEEDEEEDEEDEKYPEFELVSTVAVKEEETKDFKDNMVHESDSEDTDDDQNDYNEEDDDGNDGEEEEEEGEEANCREDMTEDRTQQIDLHEEVCSINAYGNEAISEAEEESNPDSSEGEQSICVDQDKVEDIDLCEEDEIDDLLSCNDKNSELESYNLSKDLSLKNMSRNEDLNNQTPTRKDGSTHLEEQATVSNQEVTEDEQTYTENERRSWLCCLKSCSLSQTYNKRENQKRCSEDGNMDLLQLNPVESGSSYPDQELPASPTFSRNTEVASVLKTASEDSSEELSNNEKKSENPDQGWSDSEDDVHSFYD